MKFKGISQILEPFSVFFPLFSVYEMLSKLLWHILVDRLLSVLFLLSLKSWMMAVLLLFLNIFIIRPVVIAVLNLYFLLPTASKMN